MLLDDERHVIKWLSQYGALTKTQVIRLLRDKTPETAEKILRNLKREHQISDVAGGYYLALDGLWVIRSEYHTGEAAYEDISHMISLPQKTAEPQPPVINKPAGAETLPDEDDTVWPEVDFAALREINPDIVAWIYIEGTKVNYPIVQGEDNSYYLKHLFSGEWNGSGCIFLDFRNDASFADRHSIIYGHHMKNGTMFTDLDAEVPPVQHPKKE